KGIPCHESIIKGYLKGMTFSDKDRVIFLDLVPNRYAEFGRACVRRTLAGEHQPPVIYYGLMRKEHKDVSTQIETEVFQHWDSLSTSPAKTRPRPSAEVETVSGLKLLTHDSDGNFGFPEHIMRKFEKDTEEYKKLAKLKADFEKEAPSRAAAPRTRDGGAPRVRGQPDFSINDGKRPIDIEDVVDLEVKAPPDASQRLATIIGKATKPSIIIDKDYKVWVGNEHSEKLTVCGCELFGFNTGNYEERLVDGGKRHASGIAWRVVSDFDLVSYERKLTPDVTVLDHELSPKLHAPADGESEAVPVAFRYDIRPLRSLRTNVFRPNNIQGDVKVGSAGALWLGKFEQLPSSRYLDIIFE
ncbi:FO synthase subunit 1, partial [Durusdinium trenchii]